jgi:ABC-2 type transport system permease protein
MIRTMQAELVKLMRRRVLITAALTSVVFAVGGAAVVLMAAEPAGSGEPGQRQLVRESLAAAGGGTDVFSLAISYTGTFLFVVFVGAFAVEYSRGTFRTMLLRQPGRVRLLAGKLAALLAFAGAVLAVTELLTWVTAYLLAPSQDVTRDAWVSWSAVGSAFGDYARVLFWVGGYAVLGLMIAVLVRSVPVALAIGIAWAGPLEHITQDSWAPVSKVFPGLLLEAFVAGGTPEVSASRAFLTVAAYVAAAAVIAGTLFRRRDIAA